MEGSYARACVVLCVRAGVRLGAANTLRGLSRSVRILRGVALTPNLAPPLVALLQDSSATDVQVRGAGAAADVDPETRDRVTSAHDAERLHPRVPSPC